MKFTLPKSPAALALILFITEMVVAVLITIAGRMSGVEVRNVFMTGIRLYIAAVIVAVWYVKIRRESMSKHQSSTTALIYCVGTFLLLAVYNIYQGAPTPIAAVLMLLRTLLVLAVQYLFLYFLFTKVSALVYDVVRDQQKLPGL